MIIWGRRGRTTTLDTGEFACPACRVERPYAHRQVRRWFTLYFVPCFPLDVIADYVECESCHETFRPGVVDEPLAEVDPEFASDYRQALAHVMVAMLLVDGDATEAEVDVSIDLYEDAFGIRVSKDLARRKIEQLLTTHDDGLDHLRALSRHLSPAGRDRIVRAGYRIADADGRITDAEKVYLKRVAEALGMSREQFLDLVVACRDQAASARMS